MKKFSFFYFIPTDLKNLLSKRKKELLALALTFIGGLIVGIVIASSSVSDCSGSFILILSNEFNPFRSLWIYSAILVCSVALCFCCGIKNYFAIILLLLTFFIGYVFGRICCFSIVENTFWGIISITVFVIPNSCTLLFLTYLSYCKMRESVVCGSFKNNKPVILWCLKIIVAGFVALFAINVVIGGLINLLINVV